MSILVRCFDICTSSALIYDFSNNKSKIIGTNQKLNTDEIIAQIYNRRKNIDFFQIRKQLLTIQEHSQVGITDNCDQPLINDFDRYFSGSEVLSTIYEAISIYMLTSSMPK